MSSKANADLERLGAIVEDAASEVYLFSAEDFCFTLVNRGARENLGFTMAELRRRAPWDIKPEFDRERFIEMVQPLIEGSKPHLDFETLHRRKDGSDYDVRVHLQLMHHESGDTYYAAIEDITEQKRAEARLKEVTARLDAILNNTTNAIFVMDARQHCAFMNRAAEELTGYAFEEVLGRPLHDVVHHTYPDGRPFPIEECAIDRAFPEDNQTQGEEYFVHKDGSFYPVGYTASPMKDPEGKTVGTIIEVRDISEELKAREAVEAFNEALQERVEEALAERKRLEAQLVQSQKMEAVGQLTGGIAHDFNNLLQVIQGNLQLLQKDIPPEDSRHGRLTNALTGVERGTKLASQLLAFGRRQPLEPKPINLGRLVRGLDDMLRRTLGEAVEIETVITGGLWNCFADAAQVENVILNLAINARDAMEHHGKLTIELGNAALDDRYADAHLDVKPGQYVMLAVTDTGCGIAPEILERVFDPFFTTKRPGEGTGLGLSMVFGFVKQSEGHVKIYSEPGVGTTVRIYLPRTRKEEEVDAARSGTDIAPGQGELVLVVEDDENVRAIVVELLDDLGYTVLEASDADSALAIINSGLKIDLLFTDVVMPGRLRSPELARRAQQRLPGLAVLFTSGYTQNAIVHAGRLDDGVELLSKPYSRQQLALKVRKVLDRKAPAATAPQGGAAPAPLPPATANGTESARALRILLVEDEVLIRMTTADMLRDMGHEVIEAGRLAQARDLLSEEAPDVLIADLGLPDGSGSTLVEEALAQGRAMGLIVASGADIHDQFQNGETLSRVVILNKPYQEEALRAALGKSLGEG